jgi:hypothetical protein
MIRTETVVPALIKAIRTLPVANRGAELANQDGIDDLATTLSGGSDWIRGSCPLRHNS